MYTVYVPNLNQTKSNQTIKVMPSLPVVNKTVKNITV